MRNSVLPWLVAVALAAAQNSFNWRMMALLRSQKKSAGKFPARHLDDAGLNPVQQADQAV